MDTPNPVDISNIEKIKKALLDKDFDDVVFHGILHGRYVFFVYKDVQKFVMFAEAKNGIPNAIKFSQYYFTGTMILAVV